MKKITKTLFGTSLLVAVLFTSCKSEQESASQNSYQNRDMIVKAKLEKRIKSKLEYPDSYEFVELTLKDSVLFSDNVKYNKNYYSQIIEADKKIIQKQEMYKKEGSSSYKQEKVERLQAAISKNEKILAEIERVSSGLGNKAYETASCTYTYSFKSKNTSGKDGSYTYVVQAEHAPEYKVTMVAKESNLLASNSHYFPGYDEIMKSFE